MTDKTTLAGYIEGERRDIDAERADVVADLRSFASHVLRVADRVADSTASLNRLGELQAQPTILDARIGGIASREAALRIAIARAARTDA